MRIAIVTLGSRGDVQPYIALGKGLQARGHEVRLAAPENVASWVEAHGLAFHGMGMDIQELAQSADVKRAIAGNPLKIGKVWRTVAVPMMRAALEAIWETGRDADVIVYHPKVVGAADVAEKTGATPICASPIPMSPTRAFAAPLIARDLGGPLNRLSWAVFRLMRAPLAGIVNAWRRDTLGLPKGPTFPPIGHRAGGLAIRLCAVSPAVVPRPQDWDADAHMTGYWFLDEGQDWQPDPALAAFLAAGPPPIYVGFGSMPVRDPETLARAIVEGTRRAGVRAILATGWGGLAAADVPDTVHIIDGAPHDALFPRVAAVVHHGGAGTTAAGLRAGRPTLVCPLSVDQPFWGKRVARLGCGPPPLPLNRLTADRLAARLKDRVENPAVRAGAGAIAERLADEDGVGVAVSVIEKSR